MHVFRLGLFLLITTVVSAQVQVQLQPLNAAVLRGSKARFNCSTTQPPSVMTWTANGRLVINILEASGVTNSADRFSATNFTTPGDYRWEFAISNVQRDDAGEVTCQVLGGVPRMATLSVQERGSVGIVGGNQTKTEGAKTEFQCRAVGWFPEPNVSWSVNGVAYSCNTNSVTQGNLFNSSCTLAVTAVKNSSVQCLVKIPALSTPDSSTVFLTVVQDKLAKRDQTVLIAVTVAFSAAALLFLIIYGIVFFCKRRKKKSSYQEELRRARIHSQNRTPATENVRGRDNRGYIRDRHDGHTNGGVWYTNHSNKHQMPDGFFDDGHRNDRHMTIL
ncbi:immunoglobulin superfamily member 5-like isoform X2 [Sinocyclocheilus rhinocerous]|uniref:immunoglobulin superfamily member 5-like isoform X2 n=1 Tax=Sinocyclocheilus rhinocerous TaxID=307959 RepID=UPI0007B80601|nr:PREDICTED: immunoglobulin superfamily member 5-like isoform X2 [Sinocyclocheilus rhinocerous]